jgi:hypothetical protein
VEESEAEAERNACPTAALEQRVRAAEAAREAAQRGAEAVAEERRQEPAALERAVRRAAATLLGRMAEVEAEEEDAEMLSSLLDGVEGAAGSAATVEGLVTVCERVVEVGVGHGKGRRQGQ